MYGCEEKVRREKEVKKSVQNKVNLMHCLLQEKNERNRIAKSLYNFLKDKKYTYTKKVNI